MIRKTQIIFILITFIVHMTMPLNFFTQTSYAAVLETIAQDDFGTNSFTGGTGWIDSWSPLGNARIANTDFNSPGYCVELVSNNSSITRTVDLTGWTNVTLSYYWRASSFEGNEYAYVIVDDGTEHTVHTITKSDAGKPYSLNTIDLSTYNTTGTFRIKFLTGMKDTNDFVYFDDVLLTGYKTVLSTPTPTSSQLPTPTATPTASPGTLTVEFYNDKLSTSINTIFPFFRLTNQGGSAIDLSTVKLRYYFTIDGEQTQNFWCDWSTIGSENVTGIFMKYIDPHTNADYYLEIGFISGAGSLAPGSVIEVRTRIAKTDWTDYNQTNDYSFNGTNSTYALWNNVTAHINGALVWGTAPAKLDPTPTPTLTPTLTPTPTPTSSQLPETTPTVTPNPLKVEFYNSDRTALINTIYPNYRITNQSGSPIDLSTVKLRYYYTIDGERSQSFWCDGATVGSGNVTGTFMRYVTPYPEADYYLEIGFTSTAGYLAPGASIDINMRFAKNGWKNYDQTNDYSFNDYASAYTEWQYVTAYINSSLVWGIPPDLLNVTPTPTPTPTITPTPTVTPTAVRESGAWYMFDSTLTGTTDLSKDYRGNYGNAVLYGGAAIAPGRARNGLVLDGVDDYADLPDGIVSSLNDFTIATWVKLDSISDWQRIFDFGRNTSVYMHLTPKCPDEANKGLKFAISIGGGWSEQIISSGSDLSVGTWKHVAVTLSGSTGILYVDGVEVGRNSSMTLRPSDLGSTTNNYIGKSQHPDPYMDGMIDDFVIYDRALSISELRTLAGSVTRINDSDPGILYSAGWSYKPERAGSDYLFDVHDSDTQNGEDYFEYTFAGTGINLIAPKYDGNSDATVYIDGVYVKTLSMSGSANYISQTVTYSVLDLEPGTHTIKVVCSNKTWGVIDAMDIMSYNVSTPTPTPTPTLTPTFTVTPGPSPTPGQGNGLRAEYYDNMDFTSIMEIRIDPQIDFDWGEGAPSSHVGADTFSVRWIGKVEPLYSQEYTFYTVSDDGVRLWVNNVLLIDNWTVHAPVENSGTIALIAGQRYDIKMEFYDNNMGAVARLMWSSASQVKEVIPQSQLYPPKIFTAMEHQVRTVNNEFVIGDYVPLMIKTKISWPVYNPVISIDMNIRKQDGTGSGFILKEILTGGSINKNMFKLNVNGSSLSQTDFSVWTEGTGVDRKLKIRVLRSFVPDNELQIVYSMKASATSTVFNAGIQKYLDANALNNSNLKIFYEISERGDSGLIITTPYSIDSTSDTDEKLQFQADIKLEDPILLE